MSPIPTVYFVVTELPSRPVETLKSSWNEELYLIY